LGCSLAFGPISNRCAANWFMVESSLSRRNCASASSAKRQRISFSRLGLFITFSRLRVRLAQDIVILPRSTGGRRVQPHDHLELQQSRAQNAVASRSNR